ncbi:MAG: ABC transporter ATP-binding protein [Anaerolineales bacterium]
MPQIIVEDLCKTFRVAERDPGAWGAVRGLVHRRYRDVAALDHISFTIEPGELVGYIGPNGAGKSTTVKVLAGILVPDSGTCEVMGRIPWKQRVAHVAHIGVVFGQRTQLWWDLPVIESFELLREIYRIPPATYRQNKDEMVTLLSLSDLMDTPVRQLSLGQRMRCDLAAALLHSPSLLYLDEPTIGLDAVSKLAVRQFIQRLNKERGITVLLTTHDMDDVEALCRRILLIHKGHILLDGTVADLRAQVTHLRRLVVVLRAESDWIETDEARVIGRNGPQVTIEFDPERVSAPDLIQHITTAYSVRDLYIDNPPIEEVIAQVYQRAGM